ncbi:hypothetical protein IFM89_035735 [Coptis chinensis]|uniref:Uncharacterized protein n=1 Tax=Coptis chinensis TaxID=261450 RepID=A0A835H0W3_9MAGN|nr:hypothetical protein IFM89_035735 [Coptis chinensis]
MITSVSFAKKSLPPSQIGVFLRDYHGIAQGLHLKFLKNWKPRLISRLWEVAGTRYEDDKLVKQCTSSTLLSDGDSATMPLEYWTCRTSGGQAPIAWMNFFKKAIFCTKDGETCGRIIIGMTCIQTNDHKGCKPPLLEHPNISHMLKVCSTEFHCY